MKKSYWDWFLFLKKLCPDHYDHDQWESFMLREAHSLYRDNEITVEQLGQIANLVRDW